jgi:small subunit ribosomal protein S17
MAEEKPSKKRNEQPEEAAVEETVVEETPAVEETPVIEETTPEAPAAKAEAPEVTTPAVEEPVSVEGEGAGEAEGPAEIEAAVEEAEASAEEPAAVPTEAPAAEETPEPEAPAAEPEAEAPAAPVKPAKSQKHLPRSQRRQRPRVVREKAAQRKPIVRLEKPVKEIGRHQERRGIVVSDAMEKTIVVKVEVIRIHPRYKKVIRRSRKFHAHDERNQAKVGDVVRIVETRPLSKTKNWRLVEVVEVAR